VQNNNLAASGTNRRYLLLIIALFGVTRLVFYSAGIRLDIMPLLWFWQFIDPVLLKRHLFQSLFYQHTQPPLFNFLVGIVLKVARNSEILAFHLLYLAAGLLLSIYLFKTMLRAGIAPKISAILTSIFIVSPSSILYENWLFYTYPVTLFLILSAFFLHRFFSTQKWTDGLIFFSLLGLCVLTRSLFHLIWFLLILFMLVNTGKKFSKTILFSATIPFLLVCSIFVKNWFIWGEFTNSTWLGMSLFKVASNNVSQGEMVKLVQKRHLSEASLYHPYSWLSTYPVELRNAPQTEIPVLDQKLRSTGFNNYNQLAYHRISKYYLSDALYLIRHYPASYLHGLLKSFSIYFWSSSDNYFLKVNRDRILGYNRAFDTIFYGKFGSDGEPGWFLVAGIPLLLFFSVRYLLRKDQDMSVATKVTLLFITLNILYVTLVGNALETGENNRFRFEIDPYLYVLLGVLLNDWNNRRKTSLKT
jgi:hypothetical protein